MTKNIHFTVCDVLWSHFCNQHVSIAIATIFRVKLLEEYKVQCGCVVQPVYHTVYTIG
jgi:hypothetical protein